MSTEFDLERILDILQRDPVWGAYALADLEPHFQPYTHWHIRNGALILIYSGLTPPVLIAQGETNHLHDLFKGIPEGTYTYMLKEQHRVILGDRMQYEHEERMYRMVLETERFSPPKGESLRKLTMEDLEVIEALMGGQPDKPDAFQPQQVERGFFYGLFEGDRLISMAGTHILSPTYGTAAIGNIFTHPEHRGKGYATQVHGRVIEELLEIGVDPIVLNVAMDNHPAVQSYKNLGYHIHCVYLEGKGNLIHQVKTERE